MFLEYKILEDLSSLSRYVDDPSITNKVHLEDALKAFSVHRATIQQIRFIGVDGFDRVHVDAGGAIVEDEQLQDKSDRYYFKCGMQQSLGGYFVSPMDLNVEGGAVQRPFLPVLRIVSPIANAKGEVAGVLVVNFNATYLFSTLSRFNFGDVWGLQLLNQDGYWLLHPNEEQSWGFMFKEKQGLNLPQQLPELSGRVVQFAEGHEFIRDNLYQWLKTAPFELTEQADSSALINHADGDLIIMLQVDPATYHEIFDPLFERYVIAGVGLLAGFILIAVVVFHRYRFGLKLQALQRLHASILSSAEVSVITVGLDGVIEYVNPAAEQLTGWSPEELVGLHTPLLLHVKSELIDRAKELSAELGREIEPDMGLFLQATVEMHSYVREWSYKRKDGLIVPVLLSVSVIADEAGAPIGYLGVAVDISAQREAQNALRDAKQQAEHVANMKSEFLATMSHEIRTPMNGIIGLSNLLLNSELKEEQRQLAQNIVHSGNVLMTVLNDILDFSKIEAGALDLEEMPFNMHDILENVLLLFKPQADLKDIELINHTTMNFSGGFVGDSHRITQILSNLVGNALKFTEHGEVEVLAEHIDLSGSTARLRFEVRDTGIGMSPDSRNSVFSAFTQADSSTKRRFGGTGLGLSISANLVKMMGGKMGVESELGQGSTFWVELDLPTDRLTRSPSSILDNHAGFEGKSVLVVDDNETNLLVISEQLQDMGFNVKTCIRPEDAYLEYEKNPNYDLLILDYLMPNMNGLELAEQLKPLRLNNHSRLLMLSSAQIMINSEERARIGLDACLFKPCSPRILLSALFNLFEMDAKPAPVTQSRVAESVSAPEDSKQDLRIIIADDNAVNRMVLQMQLKQCGYAADLADDGDVLLERLDEKAYDVVFLDCNMPRLDGYAVARRLREREAVGEYTKSGQRVWLIAATAYSLGAERDKAEEAGMDDYLTKPIQPEAIIKLLDRFKSVSSAAEL